MKKRLVVTGATGFVGRNMCEYFVKQGSYDVVGVHHNRPHFHLAGMKWLYADLREKSDCERVCSGADIIIHAAATTSGSKDIVTNPVAHVTDNAVMGSMLFRAAHEAKVEHLIFFSCTVMYPSSEKPLTEESRIDIHPRYFGVASTKVYLEKMCEFYASLGNTKFTAIRHSNIYGAYDKFDLERSHVFGATVTKVMTANDKIIVWGTGEEERDLLYIDDLCNFVRLSIDKQTLAYRLYNCGLGTAVSIKRLVNMIISASGKSLSVEHDLTKPTIKTSLSLDCSLALKELGWEPHIAIGHGIANTIKWWKENQ